jgi:hypothetical protein
MIGGAFVPNGLIVIKYVNYDVGSQYNVSNGLYQGEATLDGLTQTPPPGGLGVEDSWAIFRVESIMDITQTVTYYNRGTAGMEITGILWGERDTYLNQTGSGSTLTQDIHGVGMHVAFFEDAAMNFNPTLGPTARQGNGNYPTVTDGQLIWTFTSVPGWDTTFPADEFFTTFRPNAIVTDTSANGGLLAAKGTVPFFGTGAKNDVLDPSGIAPGVAGRADFTGRVGSNGWQVTSNDPFILRIVPEPATIFVMLAAGLPALLKRRRSRS